MSLETSPSERMALDAAMEPHEPSIQERMAAAQKSAQTLLQLLTTERGCCMGCDGGCEQGRKPCDCKGAPFDERDALWAAAWLVVVLLIFFAGVLCLMEATR